MRDVPRMSRVPQPLSSSTRCSSRFNSTRRISRDMLLVDMTNTEEGKHVAKVETKENGLVSPSKHGNQALVELKNGKVVFRQKALSCEKMSETMQEIVKFRNYMNQQADASNSPLQNIPDEYIGLIAQLVHESDKTLVSLAKHIQKALQPEELDSEVDAAKVGRISLSALENAINAVADRHNYGVDWTEKVLAHLCIWKWEVKRGKFHLLPKNTQDKFEARIAERQEAKKRLRLLFDELPQLEKDLLFKSGRRQKNENVVANDENKVSAPEKVMVDQGIAGTASGEILDVNKGLTKQRKEKPMDPERAAKEREKAERKAAREDKERRELEAQTKSRTLMSAFFKKPKVANSKLMNSGKTLSSHTLNQEPSCSVTDFEKSFKPFVLKKGATLAPINAFKEREHSREVIVIDDDMCQLKRGSESRGSQESFEAFIANASPKLPRRRSDLITSLKSYSLYSVREIFTHLSEAEVVGDTAAVRNLHDVLSCRAKIPAKVLIFHEDTRPGYFGTFTKSSSTVGPRTPFARDAVTFDYTYDSGAEWEEEEEGADDVMSNDGEEVAESSDVESDLDDWLVGDDEDLDPGTPLSERAGSPFPLFPPLPIDQIKRKPIKTEDRREPKKRKVMPLIPFNKGPCFEDRIGVCDYEPFNHYRIQLFNDTPFPIDPFTFISTPIDLRRSTHPDPKAGATTSSANSNPTNVDTPESGRADLPGGLNAPRGEADSANTNSRRKPAAVLPPKIPFPDELLPRLVDKIETLSSGNMLWLVESLFQEFKSHKLKKNAIDAKVREICEKCPKRRVWVIKDDVLIALGKQPKPPLT